MNASEIKALPDYMACEDAMEIIRMTPSNTVGGSKAFFSGHNTELTAAAKRQIAAIEKHQDTFLPDCDDE